MSLHRFLAAIDAYVSATGAAMIIYLHQQEKQGRQPAISHVADRIGITTSSMTQLVDRLEKLGFVEPAEVKPSHDRRRRPIQLTDAGVVLAMKLDPQ